MNSEPIAYSKNFVNKFTLAILRVIERKEFSIENPIFIDADLVPRLSSDLMKSYEEKEKAARLLDKNLFVESIQVRQMAPREQPRQILEVPQVAMPIPMSPPVGEYENPLYLTDEYGPITNLLTDPSVSRIIMVSLGKPITVVRKGQKETTRIILSAQQAKEIFEKIAEAAHIPLLEGTFRAAVDNFSINAVYSSLVGSKFVIDKQTPYSSLNPQTNKQNIRR